MSRVIPEDKELIQTEAAAFLKGLEDMGRATPGNQDAHYNGTFQPIDFIELNELNAHQAAIVKYIVRYPFKGGVEDLMKAAWWLMRLIKYEARKNVEANQTIAIKTEG